MNREYIDWYFDIKWERKQATQEELSQKQYSKESNFIKTNLNIPNQDLQIKLNYELNQSPQKFSKIDPTIPKNKIEFFQDYSEFLQEDQATQTKYLTIYLKNEELLENLCYYRWSHYLKALEEVKIVLNNNIKITPKLLQSIQKLTQNLQDKEEQPIDQYLMYQNQYYLLIKHQCCYNITYNPYPRYGEEKRTIKISHNPQFLHFSLENIQENTEELFKSFFDFLFQPAESVVIGQSDVNQNENKTLISQNHYTNLTNLLKILQNQPNLQQISLDLSNFNKLNEQNLQNIQNFLQNSPNLCNILLIFNPISFYPYLKDQILEKFLNFNTKQRYIEEIEIQIGESQFKLWDCEPFFKSRQYLFMHSPIKTQNQRQQQLTKDLSTLNISSTSSYSEKKRQIQYNLQSSLYEKPQITQNQLKSIINLVKNQKSTQFSLQGYQIDFQSYNLNDNEELLCEFFQAMIDQLDSFSETQVMGYFFNINSFHSKSIQISRILKQFLIKIHEKVHEFRGYIAINHPMYILQQQNLYELIIDIHASEQKKLPYIQPSLSLYSEIKELFLFLDTPVRDLQMWSLFEAIQNIDLPNFEKLTLILYECEHLSDEFLLDFSKFLSKKGPQLVYLRFELYKNKQITYQGAKTLAKSFRNLKNASKVKLKFKSISHLNFENLSLLAKNLSENNENLEKFKLQSNFRGQIATINPGLQQLTLKSKNLKKLIISLPKTHYYDNLVSPKNFFTVDSHNNNRLKKLVICFQQVLIYYNKENLKHIQHYIYLKRFGTELSSESTGNFISTYLQSIRNQVRKVKFKMINDTHNLNQCNNNKGYMTKYTNYLQLYSYFLSTGYRKKLEKILWDKLSPGIRSLLCIEYFCIKDYFPRKDIYEIYISEHFQNSLRNIPQQFLKKLKINSYYYSFLLQKDYQNCKITKKNFFILTIQDNMQWRIEQSKGKSIYGDSIQKREKECQQQLEKIFLYFHQDFGKTSLSQLNLNLNEEKFYSRIIQLTESLCYQSGKEFRYIRFLFPFYFLKNQLTQDLLNQFLEFMATNKQNRQLNIELNSEKKRILNNWYVKVDKTQIQIFFEEINKIKTKNMQQIDNMVQISQAINKHNHNLEKKIMKDILLNFISI